MLDCVLSDFIKKQSFILQQGRNVFLLHQEISCGGSRLVIWWLLMCLSTTVFGWCSSDYITVFVESSEYFQICRAWRGTTQTWHGGLGISNNPPPLSIVLSKMTRMNWEFFDKHQGQTSVSLKALLNCDRAVGAQLRWRYRRSSSVLIHFIMVCKLFDLLIYFRAKYFGGIQTVQRCTPYMSNVS